MFINENNLRNNAEYLLNEYEIIFAPECSEEFAWWIPDAAANTTEDYEYLVDYKPFKTSLDVSAGDQIIINLAKKVKDGYFFEINNLTNDDCVYVRYRTNCGLWDDDRYELVMKIASGFKDIPDVTIQYFLLYTDQQVLSYVGALESDII